MESNHRTREQPEQSSSNEARKTENNRIVESCIIGEKPKQLSSENVINVLPVKSNAENFIQNMDWNNVDVTRHREYEDGVLLLDMSAPSPGTSGNQAAQSEGNREIEIYKERMEALKPMKRKTAEAFLDRGINKEFR